MMKFRLSLILDKYQIQFLLRISDMQKSSPTERTPSQHPSSPAMNRESPLSQNYQVSRLTFVRVESRKEMSLSRGENKRNLERYG